MWDNLFSLNHSPFEFVIRASSVFILILLLLRLAGKRQMGQMSPTEFIAILLISNAVQNSMNGGDNSLLGGIILAATLIFLSWLVSELTYRSKLMSRIFEGTPRLIVHRGQLVRDSLRQERMTEAELRSLLRKQGFHSFNEIQSAVLESDGTLSVIRHADEGHKN